MSQGSDLPPPDMAPPEVSPTGGLPADFFEEPGRAGGDPAVEESALEGGPIPARRSVSAPLPREGVARRPFLPVVAAVLLGNVVLFLGGVLAGWALTHKGVLTRAPDALPATDPLVTAVARSVGAKAPRSDVDRLKAEVVDLTGRMTQLKGRLDALPEAGPTPELGPLKARVDGLAKANEHLADLPEELRAVSGRAGTLDKALESLRTEVASLREQFERLEPLRTEVASLRERLEATVASSRGSGARGPAPGTANPADRASERGATLFRDGNYAQARDFFVEQAEAHPDDARLWYYAAVANGIATRDWRGETERLVRRGIERERAGTPGHAEIDTLFAGLTEPQGKEWLRAWRKHAGPQ